MDLVDQLVGFDEEWWDQLEDPPGYRLEVLDGELVVNPAPGQPHQDRLFNLESLLRLAARRAGLDVFTVQDHEWRFVTRGLLAQAPRPDLKVVPTGGEVPIVTVEILSPSDFGRLQSGLQRIEAKRRDYASRGVEGHLELELADDVVHARWYRSRDGAFELVAEAAGEEELVVAEPLPFRLVPAQLQRWYDDFVSERDAAIAERDAEIARLREQLGEREPPPARSD